MSRPSQLFRNRNSTIHRRRTSLLHDDHHLSFPILDAKEISHVLQACDFDVLEDMIQRPNGQFMSSLTEKLLDTFTSASVEILNEQVKQTAKKDKFEANGDAHTNGASSAKNENNESSDAPVNDDTTQSLGVVVFARKAGEFFQTCGIYDFSLIDMVRPEPYRTRRILSAVVNFIRFREDRASEIEGLATSAYDGLEVLRQTEVENIELSNKINIMKDRLERNIDENGKSKPTLKEVNVYNSKMENELRKLKKVQESLTEDHFQYKSDKSRLIQNLEDINYVMLNQSKQIELLKDYDQVDVNSLHTIIDQLRSSATESSEKLSSLELQNRNISITIDSFNVVENDLKNLFRILEEVFHDVEKEEQVSDTLTRIQETMDQQNFESTDLQRQIQQIKRQLINIREKTEKLETQSEEKSKKSQETIDQLKIEYDDTIKERNLKDQELEKLRDQISHIQNDMKVRKMELEQEINNSEMAVARLNSHLRLYLTEMNKKIQQ
ncbi:hypothetical protein CANTEDRAFT_130718 [Yamadazyma tenuis ATCC 10573]|uniref:Uncharacterized protein n=1 Tax=Candida tenuis (strain ATCC 10573 / BCRC 21748 / CBS 615 / JCM 9827 / NBRC 10315 / NRRL Y-1498 / VKM Y-70) TaxID=590646 RepID=G3B5F2_CANTC|nr:uncharacterized protein CANTEDRAFT_130718 [Yamadazyma tenuis ATCC 10573]EGV63207.1 hypothetical protein CANTEDRAFT_130718 [Yamadazyma tenuis ATCC 10573]